MGGAEEITGAADFEVGFGNGEAVGGLFEDFQAVEFFFGVFAGEQDAPGFFAAAADTSAQLMQLGQTEAFGVFHEEHCGIGHVDADFNHGGADQHARFADAERMHDGVFFVRLEFAVEQGAAMRGEQLAPSLVFLRGGFERCFGALLDDGINEISLASFVKFLAQERSGFGKLLVRADEGADGNASGRHLIEQRKIEIAVEREGQCARDRGGGHDQHVRMRLLRGKFGPLADAEFVLFVDDDQGGPADGVGCEEEGMGAYDNAWSGFGRLFFARRGAENDRDTKRVKKLAQVFVMLMGQHLGRCHEGSGVSGRDGAEHGGGGDDGFAAADIAVEEAVHGMSGGEVVEDLREDLLLRGGEIEGQCFEKLREHRTLPRNGRGRAGGLPGALAGEHALHFEEFFAGEVRAGGFEGFPCFREVDGAKGVRGGEVIRRRGRRRYRRIWPELGDAFIGELREDFEDEPAEHARAPRTDGRMDGRDAVEVDEGAIRGIGFQDFEVGMIENNAAFFQGARASVDDEILTCGEDFREIAEVEPAALHGGGGDVTGIFGERECELHASSEIRRFG